jgi:coenzyme Q-binding protein COQ10
MPSFRTTRRVRHSPMQMFALVADVERYPEFLPFCTGLTVKRRSVDADTSLETIIADMSVGYKGIQERFVSRVSLDHTAVRIMVEYVDGPFSFLENRWDFELDGEGCKVHFAIAYEFRSRLLALVAGAAFERIFRMFSEAFETRADIVYGRPQAASLYSS